MDEFVCRQCGVAFTSRQALGGHRSQPGVCNPVVAAELQLLVPVPAAAIAPAAAAAAADVGTPAEPTVNPVQPRTICQLLSRPTHDLATHVVSACAVNRPPYEGRPFKVHEVCL